LDIFLFAASALFFIGILFTPAVLRTGAPLLLLFLAIGMLMGEDGPGGIHFDDFELAYELGSIALAIILFTGGLETHIDDVRKAWAPALSLASLGVCLTTGIVGAAITLLLDVPLEQALLFGAVVGSTDAAATFLLLQQRAIKLAGRAKQTILIESGLNDPFAIFLTLVFDVLVDHGPETLGWPTVTIFASQIGLGVMFGVAGGFALVWVVNRISLLPGLYPVFVLSGGLLLYAATACLGGSGFLAVYLCGIIVSARCKRTSELIVNFHSAMAWISQIALFLMLGLLVTPSNLPAAMPSALMIAAVLMFVARPLATMICLTPFGFPLRQQAFIGWVGLRGAVPIFLAIIPVISPGPITEPFFEQVFVVVIASLVLQGWTISLAARMLKVEAQGTPPKS
jgi:NhaP-type Na+/H+ and K+/H+ antiporters with a unique C-terminal domain